MTTTSVRPAAVPDVEQINGTTEADATDAVIPPPTAPRRPAAHPSRHEKG
ncbi:hypothetical protein [Streptomyces sp. NPDC048650]